MNIQDSLNTTYITALNTDSASAVEEKQPIGKFNKVPIRQVDEEKMEGISRGSISRDAQSLSDKIAGINSEASSTMHLQTEESLEAKNDDVVIMQKGFDELACKGWASRLFIDKNIDFNEAAELAIKEGKSFQETSADVSEEVTMAWRQACNYCKSAIDNLEKAEDAKKFGIAAFKALIATSAFRRKNAPGITQDMNEALTLQGVYFLHAAEQIIKGNNNEAEKFEKAVKLAQLAEYTLTYRDTAMASESQEIKEIYTLQSMYELHAARCQAAGDNQEAEKSEVIARYATEAKCAFKEGGHKRIKGLSYLNEGNKFFSRNQQSSNPPLILEDIMNNLGLRESEILS